MALNVIETYRRWYAANSGVFVQIPTYRKMFVLNVGGILGCSFYRLFKKQSLQLLWDLEKEIFIFV